MATIALAVVKLVRPGPACRRTVQEGLDGNAWICDVIGQRGRPIPASVAHDSRAGLG
jgi:hypothetical protein